MSDISYTLLDDRGVIAVSGPDTRPFLQGLVSNDMQAVSPSRAVWSAFLTPQGKYLHDFFVAEAADGALLLDAEKARLDDLLRRLRPYRLRSKVDLGRRDDLAVAAVFGDGALPALGLAESAGAAAAFAGGLAFVDPRLAAAGARVVLPLEECAAALARVARPAPPAAYDRLRIGLGLPDGSRDMLIDKSVLLEGGFEELNGVDFAKGCYLGQEVTARTKHRGLLKRRLLPVGVEGPLPEPGTPVLRDGREVGEVRSASDGLALALLRLDVLDRAEPPLMAGTARLVPRPPSWLRLNPESSGLRPNTESSGT